MVVTAGIIVYRDEAVLAYLDLTGNVPPHAD